MCNVEKKNHDNYMLLEHPSITLHAIKENSTPGVEMTTGIEPKN
jgi:hypothetical protein